MRSFEIDLSGVWRQWDVANLPIQFISFQSLGLLCNGQQGPTEIVFLNLSLIIQIYSDFNYRRWFIHQIDLFQSSGSQRIGRPPNVTEIHSISNELRQINQTWHI